MYRIYDVDHKKPESPGFYDLEDAANRHHIAYWSGKEWYIDWKSTTIWPQSWSDRPIKEKTILDD